LFKTELQKIYKLPRKPPQNLRQQEGYHDASSTLMAHKH